jgi:hypothetical protein
VGQASSPQCREQLPCRCVKKKMMKEASPLDLATAEAAVGVQRRAVEDLKADGQDATDAEVHLRELIQELEKVQARLQTIEAQAASAILKGEED